LLRLTAGLRVSPSRARIICLAVIWVACSCIASLDLSLASRLPICRNFDGGNCEGYGEWRYWATDFERKHGNERLNVYKVCAELNCASRVAVDRRLIVCPSRICSRRAFGA
jgi:hypothetical protein